MKNGEDMLALDSSDEPSTQQALRSRPQNDELGALRDRVSALEKELAETRRLALLGATMAGLAHSIRSAQSLCRAATHMVDRALKLDEPDDLHRAWGMVKRSLSRTADLVAGLLDPESAGRLNPSPGDPNAAIREVCEVVFEQACDQDDEFQLELADGLEGVVFDRVALNRCCIELISNALDILVESEGSGWVKLKTELSSEGWCMSVSDSGRGMTKEQLKKALRGGYSSKGKGGSGLGLLQVRELVRQHGGTVDVLSEPGVGTEVRCWFPSKP